MPSRLRRLAPVAAGLTALVLAGCASIATPADAPAAPAPPTAEPAPVASEPSDAPVEPGGDAVLEPGAYVDYREGIIAETPGVKVLFFHAPWCPQCRAVEASIQAGDIPDGVTIIKADYDTEIGLRQQYGVTLQTTVVYVDDDGELLSSAVLYSDTTLDALLAAAP